MVMVNPHVHIPYHKIDEYLHFIKENRLNLEILFNSQTLDSINDSDIRELKEKLNYHPSLTIHAPYMDLSPGAVDQKARALTIQRFLSVFDITKTMNPKVIVFHSGYFKWKYDLNISMWLEGSLITWRQLLPRAIDTGVKIAIENIFEDDPENLRLLMEEIRSEYFGICFDTGHCNLFSRVPLEEWLRQLTPYIIELHLHDNNRNADDHNAIGDGTFDFDTLFSVLKNRDLIYTIEARTPENVLKSFERLRNYSLST